MGHTGTELGPGAFQAPVEHPWGREQQSYLGTSWMHCPGDPGTGSWHRSQRRSGEETTAERLWKPRGELSFEKKEQLGQALWRAAGRKEALGRRGPQAWGRRPTEPRQSQRKRKEGGEGALEPGARDSGRVPGEGGGRAVSIAWTQLQPNFWVWLVGDGGGHGRLSRGLGSGVTLDLSKSLFPYL